MTEPDSTLDVGPLRSQLETVAIYANVVEYDLDDARKTCQQAQIQNFDQWPSVKMLEHQVEVAKGLQLPEIQNRP